MPHFTFSAALTGVIPALLLKYTTSDLPGYPQMFLAIGVGQITTSVLLVPYFLHTLFGLPYGAAVVPAAIGQLFSIPVYVFFTRELLRRMQGFLPGRMIFAQNSPEG